MKKITNLLPIFKNLKPKNPKTQLKKERIMKNVDEVYEMYYNGYKNDLTLTSSVRLKRKKFTTKSLICLTEQTKSSH